MSKIRIKEKSVSRNAVEEIIAKFKKKIKVILKIYVIIEN